MARSPALTLAKQPPPIYLNSALDPRTTVRALVRSNLREPHRVSSQNTDAAPFRTLFTDVLSKEAMGNLYVKNGTPIGSVSLCVKCSYGHVIEGYRESEAIQMCTYDRSMIVPFRVKSCSNHYDKNRPTWKQMEQLAIPVEAKKTFKSVGFLIQEVLEKSSNEDDDDSCDE